MDKYTVTKSIKKLFVTVSAVAVIGTAFVGEQSAFAAESGQGSTTINGGALSTSGFKVNAFDTVVLDGTVQTTKASIDKLTVTDATGTWAGWNVRVSASPLTSESGLELPESSLEIFAPILVEEEEGATAPDNITPYGGFIDNEIGTKILSAPIDGGMGQYTVTFPEKALELTLNPKDVKTGTYSSTISVTITSGP